MRHVRSVAVDVERRDADEHRDGVAVAVDEIELDGGAETARTARRLEAEREAPATNIASGAPTMASRGQASSSASRRLA